MSPQKINKNIKDIAIARFSVLPKNVSFSIGEYGDFTRDELIEEINKESEVGKAAVELQIQFIKKMPKISAMLAEGNA